MPYDKLICSQLNGTEYDGPGILFCGRNRVMHALRDTLHQEDAPGDWFGAAHQVVVPTCNAGQSAGKPLGPIPGQVKRKKVSVFPGGRSQFWEDSSFGKEIESLLPRYPRSRKKSILLGLLIFILIAASIVSGALWQLQGINPLEILVYWRM